MPDFEARRAESSLSVICVIQVFVCVFSVTLDV